MFKPLRTVTVVITTSEETEYLNDVLYEAFKHLEVSYEIKEGN